MTICNLVAKGLNNQDQFRFKMDQIERKLEETQTEMVSVKQDASDMKGEINDLKCTYNLIQSVCKLLHFIHLRLVVSNVFWSVRRRWGHARIAVS